MKFPTHEAFYRWHPATWLRVRGNDAANFLQGQFTNDLRAIPPGDAVYGLWLNVKGKVVADSFVRCGATAEEYWIGSYFSPATVIRERLESFVIADDVVIDDLTAEWAAVTVFGEGGSEALAGEPRGGFLFHGRRGLEKCVEWVFPVSQQAAMETQLAGGRERSADEMVRGRIAAGIPAVPVDLGLGDLPNEGGLEADAISYTKGCYLGQEVMARLKSMGQVRRRLMRVAFAAEKIPALPAPVFVGERQVGELRSAAPDGAGGFVGLAMLPRLHVAPGAALAFAPDAPGIVNVAGPDSR